MSLKRSFASRNLQFRSYTPKDEDLKKHANIATPDDIGETVESQTKNLTKKTLEKAAEAEKEEIDLLDLQPKKPNWDLKRDVEKKLERLDKRTQRAVLELIRTLSSSHIFLDLPKLLISSVAGMRLASESDKTANLAEAVANAEAAQKLEADDED